MTNHQIQHEILSYKTVVLDLPDAEISYKPNFLNYESANNLFNWFVDNISWQQEEITLYGKKYLTPRLSSWIADSGLDYGYSNMRMNAKPWSQELLDLKFLVESEANFLFNSVLINYYRDGQDSNGWHSDDESELGNNPVIASISLGGSRDFQLRHKKDKSIKTSICLENGSLLIMKGTTQHNWQHCIPKRVNSDARINLTFRLIK